MRISALVLLLAVCSGCLRPSVKPPQFTTAAPPTPQELLQSLAVAENAFSSLRGEAAVRLRIDGQKLSVTQYFLVDRPDRLRSETLSPFGTPLLILAAAAPDLSVYLPTQGTFYRGDASVGNLSRFTRMPLRLEDLVGILLHRVPRFPYQQATTALEEGRAILTLTGSEGVVQHFAFDGANRLVQALYQVGERVELQIDYQDFSRCQGNFPQTIAITMPQRQVALSLDFSGDLVCNLSLDGALFHLQPPDGVEAQPFP